MFPQGWHWPRTSATGSATTTATVVYWATAGVAGYQLPAIAWAAGYYGKHPELDVRVVDRCPAGRNCVLWRTADLPYPVVGRTTISIGGSKHLVAASVVLDVGVDSRGVVFHEACHAFGGGFGEDVHQFCNWTHRELIVTEISRVYHDDPG